MELKAFAHELVTLATARNASRIVEIDRMVDILKRMFPQQSERSITAQLIREVRRMDGADIAMDLETLVHELVGAQMAENDSRLVEVDDVVIALEHMFPELSEAELTLRVIRDVEQRDGTVAWIGHA